MIIPLFLYLFIFTGAVLLSGAAVLLIFVCLCPPQEGPGAKAEGAPRRAHGAHQAESMMHIVLCFSFKKKMSFLPYLIKSTVFFS